MSWASNITQKALSLWNRNQDLVPSSENVYYYTGDDDEPRALIVKGWEELKSSQVSLVSNANPGTLNPTVYPIQAINKYRSWVYPCVNLIQRKAAAIDYYLYREVGQPNDEEYDRILTHPLITLLKRPNPFMTGRLLRQITHMHLDLCGCAFWLILRNGAGIPAELHVLNPIDLVTIELGDTTDRLIQKFVFSPLYQRQLRKEYPYADVVYFHYPHPINPMIPFTPIQALAHVTDLDVYLQVYEKDFFMNNARPDFVIVAEQPLSKQQAERISEGWNAKHRGPGKQHKPAILSRNVRIEQLGMSARDFEFLGLSEWTKDNILASYQVPEAMLGLYESFNKASAITAESVFVKSCIEPRLNIIQDAINLQLLPQFPNTYGLEFKFDNALPKDDEWDLAKNQTELMLGLTTINDIRKRKGFKAFPSKLCDVPWLNGQPIPGIDKEADDLWVKNMTKMATATMAASGGGEASPDGASSVPAAQGMEGFAGGRPTGAELSTFIKESLRSSRPGLSTMLNAARGYRGGLQALLQGNPDLYNLGEMLQRDTKDQSLTKYITRGIQEYIEETLDDDGKLIFKAYEDMLMPLEQLEEEYTGEVETFITTKAIQVSKLLKDKIVTYTTKEPYEDIDNIDMNEDYIISSAPFVVKAAALGVKFGYDLVEKAAGTELDRSNAEDEAKKAAGFFLSQSAELRARSVKGALTKVIRGGLESGLGVDEVAEMIEEKFPSFGAYRSSMIARTELMGAMDAGTDAAYEAINRKAGKIIIKEAVLQNSVDDRVCNDPNPEKNCRRMQGTVLKNYETGEVFYDTVTRHPMCRCVRKAVLK